jgi:hypothetical protein
MYNSNHLVPSRKNRRFLKGSLENRADALAISEMIGAVRLEFSEGQDASTHPNGILVRLASLQRFSAARSP